ncbi:exodeoxyribonuclease III [Iodidimonas gelatinilytica]|uniref:Exodeoxyribonuclease III n=1 Tax=Iodidimonas gelatinilytica TaxID=1236966 RepID=A0A5A7MTF3_9PROT|nr:exodeoxyribonuclease III [Iodidimonas gelatinilytica]GEQ98265.1 exodeoxyribonuclease III [Iodidimonas gelatinilytica]
MKIASFNINGVKARLPRLLEWLDICEADVVCLQELKSMDDSFPRLEFEDRGWHLETHGQKGFNGVALFSREPLQDVRRGLPGNDSDEQARYIEGTHKGVRIACLYLPNGNPAPGPKYDYKLAWMERLRKRATELFNSEQPTVITGDFNVIPTEKDCYDPAAWLNDALFLPQTRAAFQTLLYQGWTDAIRQIHPQGDCFTFWDYQRGSWEKDNGIRIDHFLLSPQAADRLQDAGIDRAQRGKEKASDHVPVWVTLSD